MRDCILILSAAFGLAACAGAAPDDDVPGVVHEKPVGAGEPNADEDGEVQVADIPTVPMAAPGVDGNARVCRNERKTGTNRVSRVCRTRAEIEQQQAKGKEVFDDLHKSQQEY